MPEAAIAHHRDGAPSPWRGLERGCTGGTEAIAHRGIADIERRQDREQVAADIGRHMKCAHLALDHLHRRENRPLWTTGAETRRALRHFGVQSRITGGILPDLPERDVGCELPQEILDPFSQHRSGIFAGARQHRLADHPRLAIGPADQGIEFVFDEFRLAFLDDQNRLLAETEDLHLFRNERIGHVQDIYRQLRVAEFVGQSTQLQRPVERVEQPALDNDPHIARCRAQELIQVGVLDKALRRRPAFFDLLHFVQKTGRWQHDAIDVAHGTLQRFGNGQGRPDIVFGREMALQMAGAYPQFQHDGGVRCFRQFESALDHVDDHGKIWPRVEQPDLRFHGEGVRALLHDGGAFAIILADDDQGAALDPAGRDIGQRVRRHIRPHHGFPDHGATQRIIDRGGQHGGGSGFAGAGLEMHAGLLQQFIGVAEHVHQMRNRRTLVAAHISDTGLQQALGHCQDAIAAEIRACAEAELFHFGLEGTLGHRIIPLQVPARATGCRNRP